MTACATAPRTGGFPLRDGPERAAMIPRLEADEQRLFLEEELPAQLNSRSASAWVIDLSEYADGVTLALAGGLASFRDAARLRGCEVQYTGLMHGGGVSCRAPGSAARFASPNRAGAQAPGDVCR